MMRTCPKCFAPMSPYESRCWSCDNGTFVSRPARPFVWPSAPRLPESVLSFARAAHPERYAWTSADDDAFNCAYVDWLDTEGPA